MEIKLPVNNFSIYKTILQVLNFKYRLTDTEIDVMAQILKFKLHTIDSDARDTLRKALDKSQFNINNFIKALKTKGFLYEIDKKVYVNPNLIGYMDQIVKDKTIDFKFVTNS